MSFSALISCDFSEVAHLLQSICRVILPFRDTKEGVLLAA